ncbi:helix-turn-helix domain-containing protein [Actinophytocola gossypii]|uniref:Helix-turn-helix domain-containing protein n=1 Tax=Actinophytocola gossypii TaxID=2812003 RepID=A0ABT2J3U5_9PSEU|nr:helix-turn-helix domain-containing protein [Actinophytocola gossypii]MCT2582341.1 helix-turn-helix domain-containing protein [Actinophytocola gossypii]
MSSHFGALLRELRRRAGLTQEALADRSNLGVRTVRRLETGDGADPRVATVRQLADALGLADTERVELLAAAGHVTAQPPTPAAPVDDGLGGAARQLAHAVRTRWQREEEQRQIHDPFPLPVRWETLPPDLTDSWANIRQVRAQDTATPLDLAGQLDHIVDVYRRIPSGRLVVLGQAGSGKTILTLRFVLDLLGNRATGDPVPVIFGLGAWNPNTTGLRDWLIEQLLRDHPALSAPGPDGTTLAAALVETGRVLPVLDGFDEIAAGLHRAALAALNGTTLPLLLTSRPDEYAAAVAGTDVLTAAGGVRLTDLTIDDLAGYLPRTTRKAEWHTVLDELRDHPHLATVLATPLMVGLARTIYSDTPDHDPTELLDTTRFPTSAAVEEHLLGRFVPTVYRYQPENRRFDPDHVQRWFGYLARHLHRLGTRDLAWWRVGTSTPRWVRVLMIAAVVGSIVAAVDIVVEGMVLGATTLYLVSFGTVFGLGTGLAFGLAYGLATRRTEHEPSRVRLRFGRMTRPSGVRHRFGIGLGLGFMVGIGYIIVRDVLPWLLLRDALSPLVAVADSLLFGTIFGLSAGFVAALSALFETPLDIESVASPADLLRANRSTVLVQALLVGLSFAVVAQLVGRLVVLLANLLVAPAEFVLAPLYTILIGIIGGLAGGLGYAVSLTAWGQWVVLARLWLPLTGRLPWGLPAFLDDAYRRGVLRRAGAVYQFRHARLQDHLAR